MSFRCPFCLSVLVLLLLANSLILQIIALSSSHWVEFAARLDLGKPKETGHFGLWTLCSVKGPEWAEDCDPLDTFFEVPPFLRAAGGTGIVHAMLVLLLIPMLSVRTVQIARFTPDIAIKSKLLCIANVAVAFCAVILSILVAIFASISEKNLEYTVRKGWSFWVQISVIIVDFVVALLCAAENFRFWQQHIREHSDPWGHRSETYGNPAFESGSLGPPMPPSQVQNGDCIAYTDASGVPYSGSAELRREPIAQKTASTKGTLDVLTYENPSYQESSPNLRRHNA